MQIFHKCSESYIWDLFSFEMNEQFRLKVRKSMYFKNLSVVPNQSAIAGAE